MRQRILIVDDNTELLELLCLAVREAGFTVARAADGVEALQKVRSFRPDLLVLDLVLPEMDGFAVCEAMRRDRTLRRIPVMMLTGLTGEFTRYAGLESGANDYVKKPVSPSELVSKIRQLLAASCSRPTRASATGNVAAEFKVASPAQHKSRSATGRNSPDAARPRKKSGAGKFFSLRK